MISSIVPLLAATPSVQPFMPPAVQDLIAINGELATGMADAWADDARSVGDLTVALANKLAHSKTPSDLIAAQANYSVGMQQALVNAFEARFKLLRQAGEDAARAVTQAQAATRAETWLAAKNAVQHVEQTAKSINDSVVDAIDNDLTRIKGVGPAFAEQLRTEGVISIQQVAALDLDATAHEAHPLNSMHGVMTADDWVGQARALIANPAA